MKVRLTETRVSNGHMMWEGDTVELDDAEAWRLIRARQAEECEPRAAMLVPGNKQVLNRPKPKVMRGQ